MNKRIHGILGISSIMANWNADFSGYPKTTTEGDTFGSDKALKYPMKKLWENEGYKVMYIKSMRFLEDKKGNVSLVPRSLKERYEQLFDVDDLKKSTDVREVLKNLFTAVDVKNFGATFAEEGNNISITGAVQFGQGFNKYEGSLPQEQSILSPFRDGKKDSSEKGEAKNSTLGTKIVSNEAHYFYPFVVNPMAYKEFTELGVTEGYTEADYQNFKRTALVSATSYATNAKEGCDNEFALFVETDADCYLPNLSEYISFEKGDSANLIRLECGDMLSRMEARIKCVEVYYNRQTTEVEIPFDGAKYFDIVTLKEV